MIRRPSIDAEAIQRLRAFIARRVPGSDVDDVLQDTWLRVHRGISRLRDEDRLGPWLYKVARSAITEHQRRRARLPFGEAGFGATGAECQAEQGEDETDELRAAECARCVAIFVRQLPSPYREAITMTELEGLSQTSAAPRLGLTVSGMKARVQRGRARLRKLFEECCTVETDVRGRIVACERRRECGSRHVA